MAQSVLISPVGAARIPTRRCAGCRVVAGTDVLLRLACDDAGFVRPDPGRRLPGRGLNVHPTPTCLDRVLASRALARAFRRPGPFDLTFLTEIVTLPADVR